VPYSSLFQYFFYRSTIVPTLVENSLFFIILVLYKTKTTEAISSIYSTTVLYSHFAKVIVSLVLNAKILVYIISSWNLPIIVFLWISFMINDWLFYSFFTPGIWFLRWFIWLYMLKCIYSSYIRVGLK